MVILIGKVGWKIPSLSGFLRTRFMSSGNEARFIPANVFPAPRNFIMQRELCPAMLKTDMKQKISSVTRKKENTKITLIYLPLKHI